MKTKTITFGMIAMLAMVMFASTLVLADDNSTDKCFGSADGLSKCDGSGVAQVSSSTIFWRQVGLLFTFNQERKMEKEMVLAQLRLQQAEYATQNNMSQAAENALDKYGKLIDKAEKRAELVQKVGNAGVSAMKLAAMDQAILAHQEKIAKLSSILENSNLTADQKVRLEEKVAHAENVTLHLQDVQSNKEEKMKIRLMAESNMTEVEAEAKIVDAKDNAQEIVSGAKVAWKNFKDEAKEGNVTPKELAKEKRQGFKDEVKNEIKNLKSNKSEVKDSNESN